jgi:NADH-quinone oxidoreductase subunit J
MNFETFDLHSTLFWILAAIVAVCSVAVVVAQNIVRAATWLLFALSATSGVFFLLGADFVGATQLLVYVGGTLVLVVFGVMLTAQGPFITMKIGAAEWLIGLVVGGILYAVLALTLVAVKPVRERPDHLANSSRLGMSLLGIKEATGRDEVTGTPAGQPKRPRTIMSYLLPFEIVSMHLLVVLIGAAYLARAKRQRVSDDKVTR